MEKKKIEKCQIKVGINPFKIPSISPEYSYIYDIPNEKVISKAYNCNMAIREIDNNIFGATQRVKIEHDITSDIDIPISEVSSYCDTVLKEQKEKNIVPYCEVLKDLEKVKVNQCRIALDNSLVLHYEMNRRRGDGTADSLSGSIAREIENNCLVFPLYEEIPYHDKNGEKLFSLILGIKKDADDRGRVGYISILDALGNTKGVENCVWLSKTKSPGKIKETIEEELIESVKPFESMSFEEISNSTDKYFDSFEDKSSELDYFPRRSLYYGHLGNIKSWIENDLNPYVVPNMLVNQIYQHIVKISPEFIKKKMYDFIDNTIEDGQKEWLIKKGLNMWLQRFESVRNVLSKNDFTLLNNYGIKKINLYDADLSGADLSDADLSNMNLCGANLYGADLREANLSVADLSDANLSNADLRNADLRDAVLNGADMLYTNLRGADLREATLYGADLREANLRNTDLSGANLSEAHLCGADLNGADLCGANLRDAILKNTSLDHADLSNADLSNADLSHADLHDTDLRNADLRDIKGVSVDYIKVVARYDDDTKF